MDAQQRHERNVVARATRMVAKTYRVFRPLIFHPRHGSKAMRMARMISQYIAHCSGSVPMGHLAQLFNRSPAAVQRNIQVIEDMRDDPDFDRLMTTLETKFDGTHPNHQA
jgi:hypothetical protein